MDWMKNREQLIEILDQKKKLLGRGLSYAEKILFLHEAPETAGKVLTRGAEQIRLYPDRAALQDATAQMAILQFIQSGRPSTKVAATIHCDHLIQAREGRKEDLARAKEENDEVYRRGSVQGIRGQRGRAPAPTGEKKSREGTSASSSRSAASR